MIKWLLGLPIVFLGFILGLSLNQQGCFFCDCPVLIDSFPTKGTFAFSGSE